MSIRCIKRLSMAMTIAASLILTTVAQDDLIAENLPDWDVAFEPNQTIVASAAATTDRTL